MLQKVNPFYFVRDLDTQIMGKVDDFIAVLLTGRILQFIDTGMPLLSTFDISTVGQNNMLVHFIFSSLKSSVAMLRLVDVYQGKERAP